MGAPAPARVRHAEVQVSEVIVEIFLVVDPSPQFPDEAVRGRCPFFSLEASGYDEATVREFLKGSALVALSNYKTVPDVIKFRVSSKVKEAK